MQDKIKISIIMPALNEEDNIVLAINNVLKDINTCGFNAEVIVVNDGSTDNTAALVKELMKNNPMIRMIEHNKPKGLGASFWDGVSYAEGEAVVFLPADNENFPCETLRYVKLLEDVDMVIPFVWNKEVRSPLRRFLSFLFCFIVNTTFFTRFHYTNGTVIYRKSVLVKLKRRCSSFFYQTDILVRLSKSGYLFAEVPYFLCRRLSGGSKAFSIPLIAALVKDYLKLVWDFYFRKNLDVEGIYPENSLTKKRKEIFGIKNG
ncbi:MAG: glycosyltransferase family 2 protein [Candidatus Omnitrophica bacterium]|nr:glycosyltransferase family 2 protein [Candidatus Omnitrophota bacterium]